MRTLIGAVVGLAVATLLVALLGVPLKHYAYLGILAGGLAAGLLMKSFAGQSGSPYGRGALAALVTGLAAVLGPLLALQWYSMQRTKAPAPLENAPAAVASADDDQPEATDVEIPEEPIAERQAPEPGTQTAYSPGRPDFSTPEVVCMVVGCLLAYQLGKGPESSPVADGQADENDPPAEDATDEATDNA